MSSASPPPEPSSATPAADGDGLGLALRLTLLGLLWNPIGPPALRAVFLGLGGLGLLLPEPWLRRPWPWLGLAAAAGLRALLDWPLADNHAYLLAYWLLAVGLCLRLGDARQALARTARWLLGLTFLLATLWKAALAPDFLDGRFFRATLLIDPRFETFTELVAGLAPEDLEEHRDFLLQHLDGELAEGTLMPSEPPRLRPVAMALTWWTLAVEAAVAAAFLWPPRLGGPSRWRDPLLLAFCAGAYAVATVAGFAWLLLSMGLAQARPGRGWRVAYLGVFLLMLLYRELPWGPWLLALGGDAQGP